ncbi:hypothetical protein NMB32_16115 [Stenotrophomonas sp. CD2]|nr:hypothetical protein NMB32_16115 [Stenotrophomonas sp. CD2]
MSAAPTTAVSRDPATGQQIASHPFATDAELEAILDRGRGRLRRRRQEPRTARRRIACDGGGTAP